MCVPAFSRVTPRQGEPTRHALFLHGILGSGSNLRSLARQIVDVCPDWEILLVDLRNHGASHGADSPHTVTSCARDLTRLCQQIGIRPTLIAGHSFGGKVALGYARNEPHWLQRVWVLDARPGIVPEDAQGRHDIAHILSTLRGIEVPAPTRDAVAEALREAGFSESLVGWMGTNLQRSDEGFCWKFDLDAVQAMIEEYWRQDFWPFVEGCPAGLMLDFVRAERGDRWHDSDIERLVGMQGAGSVALHTLSDSGHWVHVDNPKGLMEMMLPAFLGVR